MNSKLIWIVAGVVLVAAVGIVLYRLNWQRVSVDGFESCKAAKGEVMESYPEQCHYDGKTYVNEAQQAPEAPDTPGISLEEVYIGMAEQEALDKAARDGGIARVVERDGQPLPTTMDFREGRLNLAVRDGKVIRVDVEGRANDKPLRE